ncbi:MAG: trypsin-like peptidase domain-containing protein, partial [Gemmataceae bacterium]|nr:trypsin-like peptidase domain-containing protein [Gemmataceae bacterium]
MHRRQVIGATLAGASAGLLLGLLAALIFGPLAVWRQSLAAPAVPEAVSNADIPAIKDATLALSERFQQVVLRVSPAVVAVDAIKPAAMESGTRGKPVEESGSGVLLRWPNRKGTLAITNHHVIGAAAPAQIYVTLADGRILQPNRLWTDPESDLALLHFEDNDLPTAELGDSDKVQRGQWVLAIGSPFGLNQTVTHGIISATNRGQIHLGSTIRIKEFLQTDAAINPGSSGGP